jgi:hypothetical protein
MIELRELLERLITHLFRSEKPLTLIGAGKEDQNIEFKKTKMVSRLCEAQVIPQHIGECVLTACANLNDAAHPRTVPPTGSDFIRGLKNVLPFMTWYEQKYHTVYENKTLQEEEVIPDTNAPYKDTIVVLASTIPSSDIEDEWLSIKKYLVNYGVHVVHDEAPVVNDTKLQDALFIQLFSTLDPLETSRQQLTHYVELHGPERVFQWRKPLPNPRVGLGDCKES